MGKLQASKVSRVRLIDKAAFYAYPEKAIRDGPQ